MRILSLPSHSPLKRIIALGLTAFLALSAASILIGCSSNDDAQRIHELEAEVDRLQSQQSTNSTDQQTNNPQQESAAVHSDDATIQSLSDRAEDLISRANAAEVPDDRNTRIDAFFSLDSEFNQLEAELDSYENQKETEYRNGSLNWDQYRSLELQIEQIEDRMESSQNSLELRFGIDD